MKVTRLLELALAVVIGIALAEGASSVFQQVMEEPEMRRCGTYQPLFFRPLPEPVAKMIAEECKAKLERMAIIRRFRAAYPWPVYSAASVIGFLFDPLHLIAAVLFSVLAAWVIAVIKRTVLFA